MINGTKLLERWGDIENDEKCKMCYLHLQGLADNGMLLYLTQAQLSFNNRLYCMSFWEKGLMIIILVKMFKIMIDDKYIKLVM